jgi:hypothetical protein
MDPQKLQYKNKFINPNVDRIQDTENNLFKDNDKYKTTNVSGIDLTEDKLVDLDNERTIRERITVINIDSRDRDLIPKNKFKSELFTLIPNPLEFHPTENRLTIIQQNNPYKLNDKIAINNVAGKNTKLKHSLFLKQNSQYIKIRDPGHNMTFEYNNKNIFLDLSNINGNNTSKTLLAGVPINFINRRHEILFRPLDIDADDAINMDQDVIDLNTDINYINSLNLALLSDLNSLQLLLNDNLINEINPLTGIIRNFQQVINKLIPKFYLLKIPIVAKNDYVPDRNNNIDIENTCIKINFLHLFGIPIGLINADFPITIDRRKGNHIITKIIDDSLFEVMLDTIALEPRNILDTNLLAGGGSCIELAQIDGTLNGYSNPNNYVVQLGRTLHNVKRVELIGSIFPNTEQVFKNDVNNKLYWNNLEDGPLEYNICIDPGNYPPGSLEIELNNKFSNIKRGTIDDQIIVASNTNYSTIPLEGYSPIANPDFIDYVDYHIIKSNIDISKDEINFSSFKTIYVKEGIQKDDYQTLRIFHPYHVFDNEDIGTTQITINFAKDTEDIPAQIINGTHTISDVFFPHIYTIILPNYEPLQTPNINSFGGQYIEITYPDKFRMLFNKNDTMGNQLGFNFVDETYAITPFLYTITNKTNYDIDDPALFSNVNNTVLQLSGDSYILMVNDILSNYENTGPVLDVFAKIQLQDIPNTIQFNTFVASPKIFEDPITSMFELEFMFYSPNNTLYNFNNVDHSFSLRITELISLPRDSHINSRTGNVLEAFAIKDIIL